MNLNFFHRYLIVALMSLVLMSCEKPKETTSTPQDKTELKLGMSVTEVKEVLKKNNVDLYFKKEDGSYDAFDPEYGDYLSRPPANGSPRRIFKLQLSFDKEDKLTWADVEMNGKRVSLGGPITLDLDTPIDEEEE